MGGYQVSADLQRAYRRRGVRRKARVLSWWRGEGVFFNAAYFFTAQPEDSVSNKRERERETEEEKSGRGRGTVEGVEGVDWVDAMRIGGERMRRVFFGVAQRGGKLSASSQSFPLRTSRPWFLSCSGRARHDRPLSDTYAILLWQVCRPTRAMRPTRTPAAAPTRRFSPVARPVHPLTDTTNTPYTHSTYGAPSLRQSKHWKNRLPWENPKPVGP